MPELAPVSGQVTRNGQPVAGARVLFKAEGAPGAIGVTDAEGRYELTYIGKHSGAVVGENAVSIFVEPQAPDMSEGMELVLQDTRTVEPDTSTLDFEL